MGRVIVELGDITPHNIKQLKKINQLVFPVFYNDKFYKDVLDLGQMPKLAYFNDAVVGGVCSRIDTADNQRKMYIMTLGCLPSFRRYGVGTKLLEHVLDQADKQNCQHVYLHVQVSNEAAIAFYEKHGFKIVDRKEAYYKRIEPADAFVLMKDLTVDSPPQASDTAAAAQINNAIAVNVS